VRRGRGQLGRLPSPRGTFVSTRGEARGGPGGNAQSRTAHRWDRWRTFCGWAALVGAACWAIKFLVWALLAAQYTDGQVSNAVAERVGPTVLVVLVTFLLPTAGSVLGLVAGSGLVVPWVRTRPWFVGVPLAALSALAVTLLLSTLTNTAAALFSGAQSQALRIEGTDLVGAALLAALGLVLLKAPGRSPASAEVGRPATAGTAPSPAAKAEPDAPGPELGAASH
jgi:hypothetical protein